MAEHRPFLDFTAIKARVRISEVLTSYGVSLAKANQSTLKGNCPLPSHTSASKKTFYANDGKGAWYCHSDSCGKNGNRAGGNVIDFVAQMEQCSVYAAAKRIDELFPGGQSASANPAAVASTEVAVDVNRGGNRPLAFALKGVDPKHPIIQERGISVETAKAFGIGFFPGHGSMAGRVVFPLY
jgi:DNA primase